MWAPLFYTGFGYWMYSNNQIFGNKFRVMATIFTYKDTDVSFWTMSEVHASFPLFYGFFLMLLILVLKPWWREALNRVYPTGEAALEGDEVLDSYFDSLSLFSK